MSYHFSISMEIEKFMITADHFVVCGPDETVSTAITKMVKNKIGSILIKELDTVIGIVTAEKLPDFAVRPPAVRQGGN